MGASGLFLKSLLSGSDLAETVGQELPIEFETDAVGFDLIAWFQFSPTISLSNLRVKNVEGFASENILTADEVSARARLPALFQSRVEIPSIVLRKPTLFVNRNRGGKPILLSRHGCLREMTRDYHSLDSQVRFPRSRLRLKENWISG